MKNHVSLVLAIGRNSGNRKEEVVVLRDLSGDLLNQERYMKPKKKCELCEKEVPRGQIKRINRQQLRRKTEVGVGRWKKEIREVWVHPSLNKFDNRNWSLGKVKLCKSCLKEVF